LECFPSGKGVFFRDSLARIIHECRREVFETKARRSIPQVRRIGRQLPLPLYTQVLIAATCGTLLGVVFGQEPYLGGLRNEHLGWLGLLLVTLLKTLAIPLISFAILDALVRSLPLRQGTKLPYLRAQCCHHAPE
jgi:L-cystine uptake protein TcyP (sodium:dicarboxylate symporter family)